MIRKALLATTLATLALQAQAANVVFNFSSDGFDDGTFVSKMLSGQFVYDDTTLVTDAFNNTAWAPVTSLSFTLDGNTYAVAGAALLGSAVNFEAGAMIGVETLAPFTANGKSFSMTMVRADSNFPFPAYAYYVDTSFNDMGAATLYFTAAVPEPESYALMLGGLGLVGFMARRRKA